MIAAPGPVAIFLSLASSGLTIVRGRCGIRDEGLRMRNARRLFLRTTSAADAVASAAIRARPTTTTASAMSTCCCSLSSSSSSSSSSLNAEWLQRRPVTTGASRTTSSHGIRSHHSAEPSDSATPALPCNNTDNNKSRRRRITFLTDVEGDRQYLERYVQLSKVLTFRDAAPNLTGDGRSLYFPYDHVIDFQSDDSCLVFGGDVGDQGGADLYVVRQFLHLRRRYPDRVHFVMGNRDINKMRMIAELGRPGDPQCLPLPLYRRRSSSTSEANASRDPVERLKWILAETMGSPRAFENRRWELEQERRQSAGTSVADMDVVESYRSSCHPRSGEISEYLTKAKLVVCLGEVLFLHGSLPVTRGPSRHDGIQANESLWSDLTPFMPWLDDGTIATDVNVTSVSDWLRALNEFSQSQVEEWKQQENGSAERIRPGKGYAPLIHYGVGRLPNGEPYPTIVRSGWCDDGMPRRFFPWASSSSSGTDRGFVAQTREFFEGAGVRLVCSGHQPQGDAPNVIRVTSETQEPAYVLICDTSYSGDVMWLNPPNSPTTRHNPGRESSRSGRGRRAVSEVLIEQCAATGKLLEVSFHGVLSDGSCYETKPLPLAATQVGRATSSIAVGTLVPGCCTHRRANLKTSDLWWTRAALKDGTFLISRGEGFNVWNQVLCARQGA